MKNMIRMIGLLTLIGFSFFYTDRVIEVIRDEDVIMIELESKKDQYYREPVDATVVGDTVIPGVQGRRVNVDESYKKMKESGLFNEKLIVYEWLDPKVSVRSEQDKYLVLGNAKKQMVSLLFALESNKYLEQLNKILEEKEVMVNFFVDYSYLISNAPKVKEFADHEFYSYGDHGKYAPDNLLFSNNLISRIRDHEAIYCLASNMDKEVLELCAKNNLYTVVPDIIGSSHPYQMVRDHLTSGSMIFLSMNQETMRELPTIIDYIRGKGLKIGKLSSLLNESLEEK